MKPINGQSDPLYWFMHQDSSGARRIVFYSDATGNGSSSYGNGAVINRPPFVLQSASRSLTAKAGSYGYVNVSPPAVAGYTYLGLVGVRQGANSKLQLFSFSPSQAGFMNWDSRDPTVAVEFTMLYGRIGS